MASSNGHVGDKLSPMLDAIAKSHPEWHRLSCPVKLVVAPNDYDVVRLAIKSPAREIDMVTEENRINIEYPAGRLAKLLKRGMPNISKGPVTCIIVENVSVGDLHEWEQNPGIKAIEPHFTPEMRKILMRNDHNKGITS